MLINKGCVVGLQKQQNGIVMKYSDIYTHNTNFL